MIDNYVLDMTKIRNVSEYRPWTINLECPLLISLANFLVDLQLDKILKLQSSRLDKILIVF